MIILGVGSNMGGRLNYIQQALVNLELYGAVSILKASNIYETVPFGVKDQPDFLNMVISVESKLNPIALLKKCLETEKEIGRIRSTHWGPRTIDIDILRYHDVVMDTAELILPHPGVPERGFVLIPLMDIAENMIWQNGKTIKLMAEAFLKATPTEVRLWKKVAWNSQSLRLEE